MTERYQIYKCDSCETIVEVLDGGTGTLACCDNPMALLVAKNDDQGQEKHVPVIEKNSSDVNVKIGSIPHPMEADHYIEWIELAGEDNTHLKFLRPGDKPEANFTTTDEKVSSREFCSVHGLWQS